MASEFPIVRAPEKLGVVPTTAVRATGIDVRTGGVEVAQAFAGLGGAVFDLGIKYDLKQANTQFSEYKRRVGEDNVARDIEVKNELDPDKHEAIFKKHIDLQKSFMPTNRRAIQAATIWNNLQSPKQLQALVDSRQFQTKDNERTGIFSAQQGVLTNPATLESFEKQLARVIFIDKNNPDGTSPTFSQLEAAKILADTRKMAEIGMVTNLYGAGKYEDARKSAKAAKLLSPRERESLLNTIDAEERRQLAVAKETKKQIVNEGTSTAIREYFSNELTVKELNERHEDGLIRDSEFKFMMKGLQKAAPDNTDPFAAGEIRRAMADFDMGAIDRATSDKIVLENYTKLDATDRSKVVADLEDIEAKVIATAKSNAYNEGRGLMSQRFVGVQSEEDLIDLFRGAGLTDEEKKRINRRWTAEVNNRDLYERAVDDRFAEMRKEGISDTNKYKSESLRVLLQYQRRNRLGLEALEIQITEEQRRITGQAPEFIGPPEPVKLTLKSVGEMTTEEKQKELVRIRELKRLAR